ncbi:MULTISPECIES: histidine phosphatase family protein [unclassified Streptomyces]|uniref:histidine phosphatase family protein n=1 Tax=unclassified Streptomyces TaxID=2593676 RepID=UPI003330976D
MGELVLIGHGETAWSRTGQHAARTDLPLTEAGEDAARALAPRLAEREFAAVCRSPRGGGRRANPGARARPGAVARRRRRR